MFWKAVGTILLGGENSRGEQRVSKAFDSELSRRAGEKTYITTTKFQTLLKHQVSI